MPIKDLLEEWHAQPRPLILIDEIRPDDRLQRGRQFYIYTAVLTDTRTACEIAWSAAGLREFHLKAEEHARALKGRVLFGAAPDARHEPFRNLFYSAMARCEGTATVVTSNEVIRRDRRIVRGGINAEPAPGETRTAAPVRGPELLMFMNLVKQIATDRWPPVSGKLSDPRRCLGGRSEQCGASSET